MPVSSWVSKSDASDESSVLDPSPQPWTSISAFLGPHSHALISEGSRYGREHVVLIFYKTQLIINNEHKREKCRGQEPGKEHPAPDLTPVTPKPETEAQGSDPGLTQTQLLRLGNPCFYDSAFMAK